MRKTWLGFLTLLMLTPLLVCSMAMQANSSESQPCHQTGNSADVFMFVLDCIDVDLQQQNANHDVQTDISTTGFYYVWVDLVDDYSFLPASNDSIRGPPEWIQQAYAEPSLIYTTQRFRI